MDKVIAPLIALAIVLIVVIAGFFLYRLLADAKCTVGIEGTSALVTIQGWGAQQVCQQALSHPETLIPKNSSTAFSLANLHTYESTQPPTPSQTVVCEYKSQGFFQQRFIVRDEGIMKIVGVTICNSIRETLQSPHLPTFKR